KTDIKIPFAISTLFLLFLLSSIISGLHIQESYWILVFVRNFIVYVASFSLFIVVINVVKSKHILISILWALSLMGFLVGIIGVIGLLTSIPPEASFTTPITKLLPESLRNSEFLKEALYPSISGYYQEFFGLTVKRLSSIFLYPNYLAAAIIILFPYQFLLYVHSKGLKKIFVVLTGTLLLLCMIFTYSRGALLGLFLGFVYFIYLQWMKKYGRERQKSGFSIIPIVSLGIILILIISVNSITQIKPLSLETRSLIVKNTLQSWKDSPIFGWGTQRNMRVAGEHAYLPPLGSHSTYLSLLYRYGLSGTLLFLGIFAILFFELNRTLRSPCSDSFWKDVSTVSGWAFFGNLVQAIFTVMDYDVVILFLIWMNWGFILVARKMAENEACQNINGDTIS
ncbi:MAG: O-antigen ligase family protein, partial [Candidatus Thorarchaeota archaeon]